VESELWKSRSRWVWKWYLYNPKAELQK
jgi:hypothetical protein